MSPAESFPLLFAAGASCAGVIFVSVGLLSSVIQLAFDMFLGGGEKDG